MLENFMSSFFASLAAKYLPRFLHRSKPIELHLFKQERSSGDGETSSERPAQARRKSAVTGQDDDVVSELLRSAASSKTRGMMATYLLRAAVKSTNGTIQCTGQIVQGINGPRPNGSVSITVGYRSIHSGSATEAILLASAMELLENNGYVDSYRRGFDSVVYKITAAGIDAIGRIT